MAHFAKLDENNIVRQVVVVADSVATDEAAGIAFLESLYGTKFNWKQTSYNESFRKNYAGIGYTYDASKDAFIQVKPFDSWVLNETTCKYESPTPYPSDGKRYIWDEEKDGGAGWVEIE